MVNKDFVKHALTKLLQQKNITALDEYWSEQYIQHDPLFPNGREPFKAGIEPVLESAAFSYQYTRMLADNDLVAVHGRYIGFGPKPLIAFDLFRVQHGKIVEHWDGLQTESTQTASGRTMLDGPTEIQDLSLTEANKQLVQIFANTVLVEGNFEHLADYFVDDHYLQHSPNIADGVSGLGKAMQEMAQQGIAFKYQKVHRVLGEGNFVLTQSEGTLGSAPYAFYDLFRLEQGKITEHWDVMQEISSNPKNDSSMF